MKLRPGAYIKLGVGVFWGARHSIILLCFLFLSMSKKKSTSY
jgi:hypothetical protein